MEIHFCLVVCSCLVVMVVDMARTQCTCGAWSVVMVVDVARTQCTCGAWSIVMVVDVARTQCTCGAWSVAMVVDVARTHFNKGAIFSMLQSAVIRNLNHLSGSVISRSCCQES